MSSFSTPFDAAPHQCTADPAALMIWSDRHRRERSKNHPLGSPEHDFNCAEQNVTQDATVLLRD